MGKEKSDVEISPSVHFTSEQAENLEGEMLITRGVGKLLRKGPDGSIRGKDSFLQATFQGLFKDKR